MDTRETNTATTAKKVQEGVPLFRDNPIAAIGLVLMDAAAGMRGDELPTEKLKREAEAKRRFDILNRQNEQKMELEKLQTTLSLTEKGTALFGGADLSNPETAKRYNYFVGQAEKALPGFGQAMGLALDVYKKAGQGALEAGGEHAPRIHAICGLDQECITGVLTNPAMLKQLDATADRERLPGIMKKFQRISADAGGDEKLKSLIADGKWTLSDLNQLPEGYKFTPGELRTIARSPEIQSGLIEFGFEPPSTAQKRADAEAGKSQGNLTFKEVEEGGEKYIVGLDPATGQERSRIHSGTVGSGKPSALEEKIAALEEADVPHEIALKVVAGAYKQVTDAFQRSTIIDQTTGEQIWPKPSERAAPTATPETPASKASAKGTGGQAAVQTAINRITDFFGAGLQFKDTQEAVNALQTMKTMTILGLSTSMATRDTNMVRGLIQELLPDPAKFTVGDATALSKITAVRDWMADALSSEQEVLDNPNDYPPQMVRAASASTKNLKRLVNLYDGVIKNWNTQPKEEKLPEGVPKGSKKIGTKNGKPVYETPEGKRLMVTE